MLKQRVTIANGQLFLAAGATAAKLIGRGRRHSDGRRQQPRSPHRRAPRAGGESASGKPRGMLSAASGVVTEMPDGPRYADWMIAPAAGMVLRRLKAGPETSPA